VICGRNSFITLVGFNPVFVVVDNVFIIYTAAVEQFRFCFFFFVLVPRFCLSCADLHFFSRAILRSRVSLTVCPSSGGMYVTEYSAHLFASDSSAFLKLIGGIPKLKKKSFSHFNPSALSFGV